MFSGSGAASDGGDGWSWVSASPTAYSGASAHQSNQTSGAHQHYFAGATQTLSVSSGEALYAYIYLDPTNPPTEVMLQWNDGSSWEHRAYWGANQISWGVDGTASRQSMGALPATGRWVRLEVPASTVGLSGATVSGMAFTLYGGKATWDRAGKTTLAGGGINSANYTVDTATNRLQSGSSGLGYDAAGNVTTDNSPSGTGTRSYDGENRLVVAQSGATVVGSYAYDGEGHRVKRNVGLTGETWQVYGLGGELVAEYAYNGTTATLQKEYGYRGGQLLVTAEASGGVKWLVADQLGTPRMTVDQSGSLTTMTRHDYLPFGEELQAGVGIRVAGNGYSADVIRQKFTGSERDNETGLDFMQARYFGNIQGRFTSVDPFDPILGKQGADDLETAEKEWRSYIRQPQHWNHYVYALNNPLKYVDPDGMDPITVNLNIIYDQNSKYSEAEKQKIRETYIANAQQSFGKVDIKFNVTETVGIASNLGDGSRKIQTGGVDGAINAFFTKSESMPSSETTSFKSGSIFISTEGRVDAGDLTHGIIHVAGIASGFNGYPSIPNVPLPGIWGQLASRLVDYPRSKSAEAVTKSIQSYLNGDSQIFYGYGAAKTGSPPSSTARHTQQDMQVLKAGVQKYSGR